MKEFKIIQSSEVSRNAWQEYVENHQYGTIFHLPYMYDVYKASANHDAYAFFAVDANNNIRALLSGYLQTIKSGFLSSITTRSVMLQAPIFSCTEALRALLKHYQSCMKANAVFSEIRNHYMDKDYTDVCTREGFQWEGHYNILKIIPEKEEQLWKDISRKRKDGINKSKRFGFIFGWDNETEISGAFYKLLKNQYSKLRLPIPESDFFHNCINFDTQSYCKFFNLFDGQGMSISLMTFQFKSILHVMYIGIDQSPEFIKKRPVDFFYYQLLRWCVENKISVFDWMGAGKPGAHYGVRDFKLQYGGALVDVGRFLSIHSATKYILAKTGFKMLQSLRRRH
ncbi:MAG: hypothetical protein Q8M98_11695 [Candidatus Cloacimonadaceae bacterium]|nr:hypothetical protein [Candidatus Cloacimonadaceae bacterium]